MFYTNSERGCVFYMVKSLSSKADRIEQLVFKVCGQIFARSPCSMGPLFNTTDVMLTMNEIEEKS